MRTRLTILLAATGLSLGACATDGVYGAGPALGYGYGYDTPYMSNYCDYYPAPTCGWYNGFFYPGSGAYMYDRDHRRSEWTGGRRPSASAGITPVLTPGSSGGARIAAPMPRMGPGSGGFGRGSGGFGRGSSGFAMPRPAGAGSARSR